MTSVWYWAGLGVSVTVHFVTVMWLMYSRVAEIAWDMWRLRNSQYQSTKQGVLFLTKNGNIKPMVRNVDASTHVTIEDDDYVLNPEAMGSLYGAKVQLFRSGEAEAFDPWEREDTRKWSTAQLNRYMMNTNKGEILELLRRYGLYAGVAVAFLILVVILGIYFDWQAYDVLVQGGSGNVVT